MISSADPGRFARSARNEHPRRDQAEFPFGQDNVIDIASFDVRVDENGKTNLESSAKNTAATGGALTGAEPSGKERAPAQPVKLPDASGSSRSTSKTGRWKDRGARPCISIPAPSSPHQSINDPIENFGEAGVSRRRLGRGRKFRSNSMVRSMPSKTISAPER